MAKNCTLCGGILYSLTGGKLYTLVYHSQKDEKGEKDEKTNILFIKTIEFYLTML